MNYSAPSTIRRRFLSFVVFAALASRSASGQQFAPSPTDIRRDPATTPATYVAEPATAASPLAAPPPQLLKLPAAAESAPVATSAEAAPVVGLSPPDAKTPKKLALPGSSRSGDQASAGGTKSGVAGVFSLLASLGVVLALFFGAAYLMRRGMPKQGRVLPREAVESLGRIPFPGRQQGQLLRVGNKLVLVSFSNAGADVIAEITDPVEVDRLAGMCAQADRHSSVKSFRDVVEQFFGEKPARPDPPHRNAAQRNSATSRLKEHDVA